ncbi:MAG: hypothetical protein WAT84_05090 [Candidatus Moraniibacteriota bacterium]
MYKESKAFFLIISLLMLGSVAVSYYRYVVKQDYIVQTEVDCDPYTEACFVYVCDIEAGDECTGNPVEDTAYYKLIRRNAMNMSLCDPNAEACEVSACPSGEAECEVISCDSATVQEGEECTDPVVFILEHPVEYVGVAEGDVAENTTDEDSLEGMGAQEAVDVENIGAESDSVVSKSADTQAVIIEPGNE